MTVHVGWRTADLIIFCFCGHWLYIWHGRLLSMYCAYALCMCDSPNQFVCWQRYFRHCLSLCWNALVVIVYRMGFRALFIGRIKITTHRMIVPRGEKESKCRLNHVVLKKNRRHLSDWYELFCAAVVECLILPMVSALQMSINQNVPLGSVVNDFYKNNTIISGFRFKVDLENVFSTKPAHRISLWLKETFKALERLSESN